MGFGWSEGPFEMWDSIGVKNAVQKLEAEGWKVADWVKEMLAKGHETFYLRENGKTFCYCFESGEYRALQENKRTIHLSSLKETKGVIKKNSGASLIDLGDDVALLEFHSKSNAIGLDIIQMLKFALEEVDANYKGLVIGNQAKISASEPILR